MLKLLLLLFLTISIGYISFILLNKKILSPTIISCCFFALFEFIYIIFYNYISYEISFKTIMVIFFSLIFTFIGEFFAHKTIFVNEKKVQKRKTKFYIQTPKEWTYFIFIFSIILAIYRFYDLYKFSLTIGNNSGVLGTLSSTRLAYALGEYNGGNLLVSFSTIAIEILCYVYIFFFLNNFILFKKIVFRNLLPIIGYCLIVVSFNNRVEFLRIGFAFIIVLLYFIFAYSSSMFNKNNITKKILKFSLVLAIFFFAYGSVTRNITDEDNNIYTQIVAYSSASIVGLDMYLNYPWDENIYFGYYTLQNIYDFLGIDHNYKPPHHLKFFNYGGGKLSSNIYTSLVLPIQDYGLFGMLITRLLLSYISTKFFKTLLASNINRKMFLFLVLSSLVGYMYVSFPIADRFAEYFLSPLTIIKYTLFSYLVLKYFCKYKLVEYDEHIDFT